LTGGLRATQDMERIRSSRRVVPQVGINPVLSVTLRWPDGRCVTLNQEDPNRTPGLASDTGALSETRRVRTRRLGPKIAFYRA
jgi:hypothetical protein